MERSPPKEVQPIPAGNDAEQGTKRNPSHRGSPVTPRQACATPRAPVPKKCSPHVLDTIYIARRPRAANYIANSIVASQFDAALVATSVDTPSDSASPWSSASITITTRDTTDTISSVGNNHSDGKQERHQEGLGPFTPVLVTRPTNRNIGTAPPINATGTNRPRTPDYAWVERLLATPAYTGGIKGKMQTGNTAGSSSMEQPPVLLQENRPVPFKEMMSMRVGEELSLPEILEREGQDAEHESIRIPPDFHDPGHQSPRSAGNPQRGGARRSRRARHDRKEAPMTRSKGRKRQEEEATQVLVGRDEKRHQKVQPGT